MEHHLIEIFAIKIYIFWQTSHISLTCKLLVPVLYQKHKYGLLSSNWPPH